jgi:hypothetical protein
MATPRKYCESMVVDPSKVGGRGVFICHIMLTNIEVKVAYVILGLVFQMNFTPIVGSSQVQVMVISIISLMRKKMLYLWMKCLMVIPQIWRHLLDIGWTGLRHFRGLCFKLRSNDIFLTKNWVPKIHFDPLIIHSWSFEIWYVICVELSMFFLPACYYCSLIQKPNLNKCPYFLS